VRTAAPREPAPRVLEEVASLDRPGRRIEPLPGGLTNHNYKVMTDDGWFVARTSSEHSALLAIDRDAEHRNSVAAASTGVAPEVIDYQPSLGVLVIAWVQGRTWSAADLRNEKNLPRIAAACRRLHSGPRFVNDFDMFAVQRRYLSIVQQRGFRLPARYLEFMPTVDAIRTAMFASDAATVPCHNDLLAENIIDSGSKLWLIDYEYAGNNDPCFELGNIASESNLGVDQLAELVSLYFGGPSPTEFARARLWALMSQYGWTLWAAIQDGVSDLDFDFWNWGMEKYDRAVAAFDGADLPRLLMDVRQPVQRPVQRPVDPPVQQGEQRA